MGPHGPLLLSEYRDVLERVVNFDKLQDITQLHWIDGTHFVFDTLLSTLLST